MTILTYHLENGKSIDESAYVKNMTERVKKGCSRDLRSTVHRDNDKGERDEQPWMTESRGGQLSRERRGEGPRAFSMYKK